MYFMSWKESGRYLSLSFVYWILKHYWSGHVELRVEWRHQSSHLTAVDKVCWSDFPSNLSESWSRKSQQLGLLFCFPFKSGPTTRTDVITRPDLDYLLIRREHGFKLSYIFLCPVHVNSDFEWWLLRQKGREASSLLHSRSPSEWSAESISIAMERRLVTKFQSFLLRSSKWRMLFARSVARWNAPGGLELFTTGVAVRNQCILALNPFTAASKRVQRCLNLCPSSKIKILKVLSHCDR